jgi:hypothetical protein
MMGGSPEPVDGAPPAEPVALPASTDASAFRPAGDDDCMSVLQAAAIATSEA